MVTLTHLKYCLSILIAYPHKSSYKYRVDIMKGTLLTTMRGGFNSLRGNVNDIDVDLARNEKKAEDNARQIRRLNQRLMHLEGRTEENP